MNFALVARLLSMVMVILALAFASCLGVSFLLDQEDHADLSREAFYASIATSLLAALLLYWVGRRPSRKFFRKEALCVIGLGWILASLVGSIPYIVTTPEIGFAGAIFESASGLTTTGASVLSDLEQLPRSLLFWRSLSQWIGGIGVVVFFVAILGSLGAGAKMLYAHEASASTTDFDESRVQSMVVHLIYVYLTLSLLCALSYKVAGMDWYDAVCHSFTTVATGGFSTRSASIAAFESPAIEWIAIIYMTLGGTSFLLLMRVARRHRGVIRQNTEFLYYLLIMLCAAVATTAMLMYDRSSADAMHAFRDAAFSVVSIMTTTGFSTDDFAAWSALPQMILLVLMIVGGCSGSTAGGVKVMRFIIAFRLCMQSVERSFRSRIVRPIKINGRTLGERPANEVITYVSLIGLITMSSCVLASSFEPHHAVDTSLSAVLACMFNVGPGIAEVGPTQNFDFLHPHTKLFLSLLMIMGRLELYAILALFLPSLWKRFV